MIRRQLLLIVLSMMMLPLSASTLTQAVIYYSGGDELNAKLADELANYQLIITDRFRYRDVSGNSWAYIKKKSPKTKILLYQLGPLVSTKSDRYEQYYLNNIGRYQRARGNDKALVKEGSSPYFMDNLYRMNVHAKGYDHYLWLDFGDEYIKELWASATYTDVVDQPWRADGIFMDLGLAFPFSKKDYIRGLVPEKYKKPAAWNGAMHDFIGYQLKQLNSNGQQLAVNRSYSSTESGYQAWLTLDKAAAAPAYIMEEDAFFNHYGKSDIQWLSEQRWWQQISLSQIVKSSSIIYVSQTDIAEGESGVDNYGHQISYCQAARFAAMSALMTKKAGRQDYFIFNHNRTKNRLRRAAHW